MTTANPYSLEGRHIVITGAGQGIGNKVARTAASLRATVGIVDLNGDNAQKLADELGGGKKAKAFVGSVADQGFADGVVAGMEQWVGVVDGLFNNAGIIRPAMLAKITRQQWDEVIAVNLTGVFLMLQAVGNHMVKRIDHPDLGRAPIASIPGVPPPGVVGSKVCAPHVSEHTREILREPGYRDPEIADLAARRAILLRDPALGPA